MHYHHVSSRRTLRYSISILVLSLACAAPAASATEKAGSKAVQIAVNDGPLADALLTLSARSGVGISFSNTNVSPLKAPSLNGTFTVQEALERLLKDSGLAYEFIDAETVRIGEQRKAQASTTITDAAPVRLETQLVQAPGVNEEIVVTAQKRGDERLLEVPIPITVVDTADLAANGQVLLRDYFSKIPSLNLAPVLGYRQNISIRGITTGADSNPTTSVLIDEVPFGASLNNMGGLYVPETNPSDLARIEVLRGPQGTLYGASSMGGLVKFVTKKPEPGEFSGSVDVSTSMVQNGKEAGYGIRGAANVPLTENSALRISAFGRKDPGYINNPIIGRNGLNDGNSQGVRVSGLWEPSNDFSINLTGLYQDIEQNGLAEVNVPTGGFPQTNGLGDLEQNYLPGSGGFNREITAYSATIRANLGFAEILAVSGFHKNNIDTALDRSIAYGSLALPLLGESGIIDRASTGVKKFTQEVRAVVPFGDRIDVMTGAFYTDEDVFDGRAIDETIYSVDPSGRSVGVYWAFDIIGRHFNEKAVFGNLNYRITDRFEIQVGARQSWYEVLDEGFIQTGARIGATPTVPVRAESKGDAMTYLIAPQYQFSPDMMVYARFASSYRPVSGRNSALAIAGGYPATFVSDSTKNYEIGTKGAFFDGLLTVDASLFHIDWNDFQVMLRSPDLTVTYTSNAGQAKSQGAELALDIRPTEGLTVNLSGTYTNAVLAESVPQPSTIFGRKGDPLPDTPKFSGRISATQEFPLWAAHTGFVEGALVYVGARNGPLTGTTVRANYPDYTKMDVRIGARFDSWTANLFVNNLTDARGLIGGGVGYQPPYAFIPIPPRTVGLNVSRAF